MGKSLGAYKIEKSSSSDFTNIKWTQKNSVDTDKTKNKKKKSRNTSPTNIIYSQKTKKVQSPSEKVFKVDENDGTEKLKNSKKKDDKKFQNSSVSNSKIKPGFKRPGR